jgi:hypothetical protein
VAKLHIVHVNFLSFDFFTELVVFWTLTLELYDPTAFFALTGDDVDMDIDNDGTT